MLGTAHKADSGATVGRAVGLFVSLIGALFAAALCNAGAHSDNPVSTLFEAHSTPAESIYDLPPFVFAFTGMIFMAVFNSGTPSGERNYAMSLNEGGLLPGRRAPFVRRSHAGQYSDRATSCRIALTIRRASPQSKFPFGRASAQKQTRAREPFERYVS